MSKFFPNHFWLTSTNAEKHVVILQESSPGVDFAVQIVDFLEAVVLRHHFCNSKWFNSVLNWQDRHTREVFSFDISPDELKKISPDTWATFYEDEDVANSETT